MNKEQIELVLQALEYYAHKMYDHGYEDINEVIDYFTKELAKLD